MHYSLIISFLLPFYTFLLSSDPGARHDPPDSLKTQNIQEFDGKMRNISGSLLGTDPQTGLHILSTEYGEECEIFLKGNLLGFHESDQVEIIGFPLGYAHDGTRIIRIVGIFQPLAQK